MITRVLTLAVLPMSLTGPAFADPIGAVLCAPKSEMQRKLVQQFGEERLGVGMRDPETVLEVWTSPRSGNWTLVQSYADGTSCIVAVGENWSDLRPQPAG